MNRSPERDRDRRAKRDRPYDPEDRRDSSPTRKRPRRRSPSPQTRSTRHQDDRRHVVSLDGRFLLFNEWSSQIRDRPLPGAYDAYKADYNRHNARFFFDAHKDEAWLMDKYNPEILEEWVKLEDEHSRAEAPKQLTRLLSGAPWPSFDVADNLQRLPEMRKSAPKQEPVEVGPPEEGEVEPVEDVAPVQIQEDQKDDEPAEDAAPLKPRTTFAAILEPTGSNVVFLSSVPPEFSRRKLMELLSGDVLNGLGTLLELTLTDPNPGKNYVRFGWAVYSTPEATAAILDKYGGEDSELRVVAHKTRHLPPHGILTPIQCAASEQIHRDLERIRRITKLLDERRGIHENVLLGRLKNREQGAQLDKLEIRLFEQSSDRNLLDLLIQYCRDVHLFDYYSGRLFRYYEKPVLSRLLYLRGNAEHHSTDDEARWMRELDERLSLIEKTLRDKEWPLLVTDVTSRFMEEEGGGIVKCTVPDCPKKFKGESFLLNHIATRHSEFIALEKAKALEERCYYNYLADPERITPAAVSNAVFGVGKWRNDSNRRGRGRGRGTSRFGSDEQ